MTRPAPRARRRLRLRRVVVGVVVLALVFGSARDIRCRDRYVRGGGALAIRPEPGRPVPRRSASGPTPPSPRCASPSRPKPRHRLLVITPVPVTPAPGATPTPTPDPTPTPTPKPKRVAMDVDIVKNPEAVFASQDHKDWCAVAGVQMVLAVLGLVDTYVGQQREIAERVRAGSRTTIATTATGAPRPWPSRCRPTALLATRSAPSRRAAGRCGTRRSRSRRRARP